MATAVDYNTPTSGLLPSYDGPLLMASVEIVYQNGTKNAGEKDYTVEKKRGRTVNYTIYLDVLFLINFGMDIFIIWLTGRLCRAEITWWRYLVSAFAGSLLFVLLIWVPIPAKWIYYICSYGMIGILMCFLAFQPKGIKYILKCYACQLMVTFLLGGIMNWLYFSTPAASWLVSRTDGRGLRLQELLLLVIVSGVIFIVLTSGYQRYRRGQQQERYQVSLYFDETPVYGTGFLDTGNFLIEPLSRRPVVIAEADWLFPILPEAYQRLVAVYLDQGRIDYDQIAEQRLTRAKWIPYQAVGETRGELLGLQCKKLVMRHQDTCMIREEVIVGISQTAITGNQRYQMLLHTDIVYKEE